MTYLLFWLFSDKDHLNAIFRVCGTPDAEFMSKIDSEDVNNNNNNVLLCLLLLFVCLFRLLDMLRVYQNLRKRISLIFSKELIRQQLICWRNFFILIQTEDLRLPRL